ncbi:MULTISPECIES: ABC transporter permease [unclassified Streptomyces]|uniref:ABC transporter permease n=1 Tax=unclassified Streptomyces TaxID=2593676 RepID=UPI00341CD1AD
MSHTVEKASADSSRVAPAAGDAATGHRVLAALSFRNVSAVYILAALLLVFAVWIPDTFYTETTIRTLFDSQAIVGLVAVSLVIPLAAGVFNLAVGYQVGAAGIIVGYLLVDHGRGVLFSILAALVAGVLIGLVSGVLVVKARIDSFIATLGVSSLLAALVTAVSDGQQILNLPKPFADLGTNTLQGITYPVIALVLVALMVWYVLERTPLGRRIYATGGNIDAARLAGVRTSAIIVGSLMACGAIASLAGVLVTARLANADPTVGPSYLLPAFTAAFLGSTQFRGGRFNVWGAVLAVYVLAVGVKGLQLAGAPVWIPDAFNGASLLLAVGMAAYASPARRGTKRTLLNALLKRSRPGTAVDTGAARPDAPPHV